MNLYVNLNRVANYFFPVENRDCMKSYPYEYRKMLARRWAQFIPIEMQTVWWKTFPAKKKKQKTKKNHENVID